jgi:hypothetical protein
MLKSRLRCYNEISPDSNRLDIRGGPKLYLLLSDSRTQGKRSIEKDGHGKAVEPQNTY